MAAINIQTTFWAAFQILLMGGVGFLLVRKHLLDCSGLSLLSNLLIKIFLPTLIFSNLIKNFSFQEHQNWWVFPFLSFGITVLGLLVSKTILLFLKKCPNKDHFSVVVCTQNSGYVPLILIGSIFSGPEKNILFANLFLFLVGFDLALWSLGVHLVRSDAKGSHFFRHIANPPLITTVSTLIMIALGLRGLFPEVVLKPAEMFGGCALPLAMIVIGGNLALTQWKGTKKRYVLGAVVTKLLLLPGLMLLFLWGARLEFLLGFFLLLETAVPSSVSLSMISRHFKVDGRFINQSILVSHILCLLTIPLFLSLYVNLAGAK